MRVNFDTPSCPSLLSVHPPFLVSQIYYCPPKRHQTKHLEFVLPWFGTRGSEVRILPLPDQSFSQSLNRLRRLSRAKVFAYQPRADRRSAGILRAALRWSDAIQCDQLPHRGSDPLSQPRV